MAGAARANSRPQEPSGLVDIPRRVRDGGGSGPFGAGDMRPFRGGVAAAATR